MEVERRIGQIERSLQIETGTYREYWLLPKSRWWIGFAAALRLIRDGRTLRGALTPEMRESSDTAVKLSRLYRGMQDETRIDFKKRILNSDDLRPVLLEIDIAALFATSSYEITWLLPDAVSGGRTAEFVATGHGHSIEVECKAESVDEGRKLTRASIYRTVDAITPSLLKRDVRGRIDIVVADRIPKAAAWRDTIVAAIDAVPIIDGAEIAAPDGTKITLSETYKDERRLNAQDTWAAAQKRIEPFDHVCLVGRAEGPLIVNPVKIRFRSSKRDRIVRAIFDDLRDAKNQLSGKHPGLICTYIPEVDDFEPVKQDSSLSNMTLKFFTEHCPDWVYGVSYGSDAVPTQYPGASSSSAPTLGFRNRRFTGNPSTILPLPGHPGFGSETAQEPQTHG